MKTLHVLTVTGGLLLALTGSSLAASRTQAVPYGNTVNTVRTYGERDYNNPPGGRQLGYDAYARTSSRERAYRYAPPQQDYVGSNPGPSYGGPNGW